MWDVPFIALTTDFVRVRRDLTSPSDSPASNASDTPPSELSDCLWNALRADHLLRQAVSLLTLSPTLLAVPGDQIHDIFWNRSQLRTIFRDHGVLRIHLHAPASAKLADYRRFVLLKDLPHD